MGKITSGERGQDVNYALCHGSWLVGNVYSRVSTLLYIYIPLMLIFPRKNLRQSLMVGTPPGSVGELSDSGWTNDTIFIQWLKNFAFIVEASNKKKHLLIVDCHGSHKTLEVRIFCRYNGVEMISSTPYCTH